MALTRSMLKGMNLTEEQASAIIDAHQETVAALKEQRDAYKADADKLPGVQKELDALKNGEDFKAKYDKAVKDLIDYKAEISGKEKLDKVKAAYRALLTEKKVGDRYIDSVMGVTDYSDMALGEDGKLQNADALSKDIESKWGGFITTTSTQGAKVETPPATQPGGGNYGDIRAMTAKWHAAKYGAPATN